MHVPFRLAGLLLVALGVGISFAATGMFESIAVPVAFGLLSGAFLLILPAMRTRSAGLIPLLVAGAMLVAWTNPLDRSLTSAAVAALAAAVAVGIVGRKSGWAAVAAGLTVAFAVVLIKASTSAAGIDPMIRWLREVVGLDQANAELVAVVIRKTIHFVFYGLVGLFAWLTARSHGLREDSRACALYAWGYTLVLAAFDETRQSTQVGRGGSLWDVLLDMAGAISMVLIAQTIVRRKGQTR